MNKFSAIFVALAGLALVGSSAADTCNQQVLKEARQASKSASSWFASFRPRVELPADCESFIDSEFEIKRSSMDDQMRQFTATVAPVYAEWKMSVHSKPIMVENNITVNYVFLMNDTFVIPIDLELSYGVRQSITEEKVDFYLGRLAKKAGSSLEEITKDEPSFLGAFNKYLVQPCRQFESTFGEVIDGSKAVANVVGKFEFVQNRSDEFKTLAYTHKVCEAVLILDENDNAQKQLEFNKQAMFKKFVEWPLRFWAEY